MFCFVDIFLFTGCHRQNSKMFYKIPALWCCDFYNPSPSLNAEVANVIGYYLLINFLISWPLNNKKEIILGGLDPIC